jgi:hypothetical protein
MSAMRKFWLLLLPLATAPLVLVVWPQLAFKVPVLVWPLWGIVSTFVVLSAGSLQQELSGQPELVRVSYMYVTAALGLINLIASIVALGVVASS